MSWDSFRAAIESLIYRGKVKSAAINGRTLVQVTGLDQDNYNAIELLLPPGYVANPSQNSDCIIFQVGAFGSHKFVMGGDNTADAVANLQPGEGGLSRLGQLILQRVGHTVIVAPILYWGPSEQDVKRLVTEAFVEKFNAHTHGDGPVPNQQMDATDLTGGS